MKLLKTTMMSRYLVKFALRITIFLIIFGIYIFNKQLLLTLITTPIRYGVTPLHILWLGFMLMMLYHLFPKEPSTMALLKSRKEKYVPVQGLNELEMYRYLQNQNYKAWMVMLLWLCFNAIFGLSVKYKVSSASISNISSSSSLYSG